MNENQSTEPSGYRGISSPSEWAGHAIASLAALAVADLIMYTALGGSPEVFVVPALLYSAKIPLTYVMRRSQRLAWGLYCACAAMLMGIVTTSEAIRLQATWFGLYVCIPVMFLTVPTVSLANDSQSPGLISPEKLIWRSVFELVVVYPIWFFVSGWCSIFLGGWWI